MTERASGETFTVSDTTFHCFWVGDNSGYYVWRSTDGRRSVRKGAGTSGANRMWRAHVDGALLAVQYPTLKAAMWAAATKAIAAGTSGADRRAS